MYHHKNTTHIHNTTQLTTEKESFYNRVNLKIYILW